MKNIPYRSYLLGVLAIILAFNPVDRLALGLVLQDVKTDLALSDTQLGFLSGIAFAFFYAVMGIPIARWADRGNRVTIIALTTALWSGAVVLCGLVGSFVQLLVVRVLVAVGEAGCMPPAHSLIADHFNRAERPRATSRYMLGAPLSVAIGYFLAGWLNEFYGWRMTFVLLGVPGIVLAAIAWATLKEPRQQPGDWREPDATDEARFPPPTFREVCVRLYTNATFRNLTLAYAVGSFFSAGILQWKPSFFVRSFGIDTGTLGTLFSISYLIGGLLGTYFGGEWAARRAASDERRQLRAIAVLFCCFGVISTFIYLSPNMYLALVLMTLATAGGAATNGPLFATIQTLVPPHMRAVSISIILLFGNLIGVGFGPLAAGALSDLYGTAAGIESLRYALLTLCPGYFLCAFCVWRGSLTVTQDLRSAHAEGLERADGHDYGVQATGRANGA